MLTSSLQNAGCEPVRVSQVESQTKSLETVAQELREIVSALTQKLHSVSRLGPPISDAKPELRVPEEMLVPLATNLRETWRSINDSVDRLRELNAQVELPGA